MSGNVVVGYSHVIADSPTPLHATVWTPDNSPPTGTVQITPDTVTAGTNTFTATPISVSDLDQDPLTYHYAWTKNDIPVGGDSATLARQKVVKEDIIGITVTVSDGIESSSVTDDVTVGNTAPSAGTVKISPARVSPGTYTFTATPARFTDKDGDELTYHYSWTLTGVSVGEDSATATIEVDANDVVAVSVTDYDGTAFSPAATAEVTVKASRK